MEVKKGYKQTELGLIPEDWDLKTLDKISTSVSSGKSKTTSEDGATYPIMGSTGIIGYSTHFDYSGEKILVARVGANAGTVNFIEGNYCVSDNTIMVSFKSDLYYLYYLHFLKYSNLNKIVFGSGQPLITGSQLKKILIPLPPLPEQTAIATALSDMDALIAQTEKLIEKKKAMKQGMMQELLKPKKGWVTKKLGEIFEYEQPSKYIVTETTYNPFNEIPVLTAGKSFLLGYTSETFGVFQQIPVIIFDDFTTSCQYVDFKFKVKSSAIKILKPASVGINLPLAYELLKNIDYQVGDHKRHWIGEFINFEILIPSSPEEQNRIGRIIEDLLNEIAFYQSKLQKLKLQKQGMMQELLTGRIRLL